MATGTFWQRGEAIDYTTASGSKIEANEIVVLGSRIGIAGTEMANGETGSLHVFGVFELPKKATPTNLASLIQRLKASIFPSLGSKLQP